jgi:hypothetical protein
VVAAESYSNDDTSAVQVFSQDAFNPHVAYAGPFRVVATQISSNRSVQLSGLNRRGFNAGRSNDYMNLSFQIQSEPKNPILGATQAEVLAATDDAGASLVPPKDPNTVRSQYYGGGMYRTHSAHANVALVRVDKAATKLRTLKAKVGVVMLSGVVPEVVVPDPLKVKGKKFAGRTAEVTFDSLAEANNGVYALAVTVRKLGGSDDGNVDYNWSNNLQQRVELYDDNGNKLRNYGANSINNNGSAVTMSLQFGSEDRFGRRPGAGAAPKAGPPAKFVLNEWVTVTHEVTFEFRDIPLP